MLSLNSYDFSYNNLTGPISTCGIFPKAPANAFIGNSGMIRDLQGVTECNPSVRNSKTSKDNYNILTTVLLSFFGFLVVANSIVLSLMFRKKSKKPDELKISQNFEKLESMILQEEAKFTFGEVVKAIEDFHEKYCIGKGGFGRVYKAELQSGQVIAVKRLNMSDSNDIPAINPQSFKNEIRTLTNIRHRNIIRLHGFCSRWCRIFLLYEYLDWRVAAWEKHRMELKG
ncbi:hypothetical protein PRUPE_8G217300 [Prunus persica]|uniref:non-specific serine/threonine protein kinase n=1 Tax=Prunus persica TaxID=3760 RepID=A0A251N1F1_PRUPE|nr:hypothetical protein PRUPE_8G217300 [Prunus persica]